MPTHHHKRLKVRNPIGGAESGVEVLVSVHCVHSCNTTIEHLTLPLIILNTDTFLHRKKKQGR